MFASRPLEPAPAELASVALGRRVFAVLLGLAFAVSAGLCVYASQWPDPVIGFRTAVQLSGWLCILAVFVGFCARVPRNRRDLGEVTAAATGFFTGAAMLYLAYFQWSELPAAPLPLVVKTAPGVWNPAAHLALPRSPVAASTAPSASASAGGSAPHVARFAPAEPLVAAMPVPVAADAIATQVAKENACASLTGLPRLFCEERARLEYCAAYDDPACPSVIPVSPPR